MTALRGAALIAGVTLVACILMLMSAMVVARSGIPFPAQMVIVLISSLLVWAAADALIRWVIRRGRF